MVSFASVGPVLMQRHPRCDNLKQPQTNRQNYPPLPQDLLGALLSSVDDDGRGMADTALRDELMTLLVAGQETSAILLGWAAALLAHHPGAQARVAAEVATVQGLPSMEQLRCVAFWEGGTGKLLCAVWLPCLCH